jgi:hypothetical protein
MSDNLRQYRAIHRALTRRYPNQPTGRTARHVNTLAALISGIVASRRTQLPSIASKVPCGAKPESRVQRFSRWLDNDHVSEALYFLPYAEALLACLALEQLVLVIDGSTVGRGCVALMVHVVSKGRALPLAWLVRQGNKGHVPASWHVALIKQVQALIPAGAKVVLLGDGACDGIALPQTLEQADWSSGCRTATSITVSWQGDRFRLGMVGSCSKPGCLVERKEVLFTAEAYGPITAMCCWAKGEKAPLYLLTNLPSADTACRLYEKRFRIETFFSDLKSRGFEMATSHLSEPSRLRRLLIAACLAYIWIVSLASQCERDGWVGVMHRSHRCDLSLFQLGLRFLNYILNEDLPIPVAFQVEI